MQAERNGPALFGECERIQPDRARAMDRRLPLAEHALSGEGRADLRDPVVGHAEQDNVGRLGHNVDVLELGEGRKQEIAAHAFLGGRPARRRDDAMSGPFEENSHRGPDPARADDGDGAPWRRRGRVGGDGSGSLSSGTGRPRV